MRMRISVRHEGEQDLLEFGHRVGARAFVEVMVSELFWQIGYAELPEAKKEEIDGWIGTNMFIAEQLGLTGDDWMSKVQWAHDNPEDFSFLQKVEVFTDTDKIEEGTANPRQVATRLGGPAKDLASIPKVGDEKPEGSLSLTMLNFPRRT